MGPYDHADWVTLKQLKESIKWMKEQDYNKYQLAIIKEQRLFKKYIEAPPK